MLCKWSDYMQKESTREKLLESACREFLSCGYQKASLRTICSNAGVTTGALYFFFKDKSALFDALVRDTAEQIMRMITRHTCYEEEVYSNTVELLDMEHDIQFAQELITFYYAHEEAVELLFNCAWGSAYQDYKDSITQYLLKRNTQIISGMITDEHSVFNECTLHWLSQIQVEAFLHVLSHHYSQEQALHQIRIVVTFLRAGFEGLFQNAVSN